MPLDSPRHSSVSSSERRPVGLVAGWGRYPVVVAEAMRTKGYQLYCSAISGHADEALERECYHTQWVGLARLGAHLRYFQRHNIRQATLSGKIHKRLVFERGFLWRNPPDWQSVVTFFPHFISGRRTRTDDSLLSAVVRFFARGGIEIVPATQFVPELLVHPQILGPLHLTPAQRRDVAFAWRLAKEIGQLDIGQTVIVKGQAVLAVEAVEGTDECIRRAGQLCPAGGFTVVKVAKPQQDMRFDVPTIGMGTVQTMLQCGAKLLAVEAGMTLILDRQEVARFAQAQGITIVIIAPNELASFLDAA
ncbi:MAG TPA: UDP-2,3-diacylglucosamine diphosphatase LpxI [Pirellulaceae bacterium]